MSNSRFSLGSTLIGGICTILFTGALNVCHHVRYKKLDNAKLNATDSLNQDIGYLRCKLDELKNQRACYETRNIFKRFSIRAQLKGFDSDIKDIEGQIREKEQRISEIRSSNTMKMLRYIENNMNYIQTVPSSRLLTSSVKEV